jgi:diguanylate cyclase (GGDEF)-like protein/PAS domain S-box-containing protein
VQPEVDRQVSDLSLPAIRDLQRLILRVNGGLDLAATLQAVADGVVEGLGFGVAVVNLVHDADFVQVVAVAGSEEATAMLIGATGTLAGWERALAVADEWGGLRFVPHDRFAEDDDLPSWVPDIPVSTDPEAWHPMDALFRPLESATGELIGILSVDLPTDGRRPGALQQELLEMFAVQAALAIDNARLTEALHTEQQRLQTSEAAFRLTFEAAPVGMAVVDMRDEPGRFLRVNNAMCHMLGYGRDELLATTFAAITHPDHRDDDLSALHRTMDGKQQGYRADKRYLRCDGDSIWVSINMSVVRDAGGAALFAITQFEDIGERRKVLLELARRARVDPLTGLLNRASLLERVDTAIASARQTGRPGALLFCDLDGFKPVNDTHGHAVGDRLLTVIARRLESQVRGEDTAARFGGDEFVIVANALGDGELDDLERRLRAAVATPVDINGTLISVTITIGHVSIDPIATVTPAALLESADAAMYLLKP